MLSSLILTARTEREVVACKTREGERSNRAVKKMLNLTVSLAGRSCIEGFQDHVGNPLRSAHVASYNSGRIRRVENAAWRNPDFDRNQTSLIEWNLYKA